MSYQKQPELNGAYYGPPIPPPQSYNRPGRRGGGGGCCCCLFDCLCDCGCCLLSCVFKIICSILVFIGLIILIVWLLVRPHEPKFYASDASVTAFNFSSNTNQLSYNLAVNFSVRNPNRKLGIYYDQVEANAFYADKRFATVMAPTFYQGHKNTTDFGPVVFRGQSLVPLGSDEKNDYEKENKDGVYHIMVRLHLRVRFKIGLFKTGTFKPKVKCDLQVPSKNSDQKFENTRCQYYF